MLGTLKPREKVRWHRHCDYVSYAYNPTINAVTQHSPYFLMFGRHPRLIGDTLLNITWNKPSHDHVDRFVTNLQKAYAMCTSRLEKQCIKHKKYYDAKLSRSVNTLVKDDIVLVKNERPFNKIDYRWNPDPHIVLCQSNSAVPVYKVKNMESQVVRTKHRNQLLPVYRAKVVTPPDPKRTRTRVQPQPAPEDSSSVYDTCLSNM